MRLTLVLLPDRLTIARASATQAIPPRLSGAAFCSITRTAEELSVVAPDDVVPHDWRRDDGWRALRVGGPLDLGLSGVLASLTAPLAAAEVPMFAVSTFDTDYVLVRASRLHEAFAALQAGGHTVIDAPSADT